MQRAVKTHWNSLIYVTVFFCGLISIYTAWLKCNGTQGNAVPQPPTYGSKFPISDCYNAREGKAHDHCQRPKHERSVSPTSNFALTFCDEYMCPLFIIRPSVKCSDLSTLVIAMPTMPLIWFWGCEICVYHEIWVRRMIDRSSILFCCRKFGVSICDIAYFVAVFFSCHFVIYSLDSCVVDVWSLYTVSQETRHSIITIISSNLNRLSFLESLLNLLQNNM